MKRVNNNKGTARMVAAPPEHNSENLEFETDT